MAPGFMAQHADSVYSHLPPVRVKLAGVGFEEDESSLITLCRRHAAELGDQCTGKSVVGEDVESPTEDERR